MKNPSIVSRLFSTESRKLDLAQTRSRLLQLLFAGMLFPLGFAPFHLPGIALLSLAFFYYQLTHLAPKKSFMAGLTYGIGLFGAGVSWVIVSIHEYGQLNYGLSLCITLLFILYLSLFPACMSSIFSYIRKKNTLHNMILFSALWVLMEYARATLFTGFPWLRLGSGLIDTPLKYLAPLVGIYGLSLIGCLIAMLIVQGIQKKNSRQWMYLGALALLITLPQLLKPLSWTTVEKTPVSTAVIQANLSMRDKWDQNLFEQIINHYMGNVKKLVGTELIVMPESAIPLTGSDAGEYLDVLHDEAFQKGSALLTGIFLTRDPADIAFYNAMLALGNAQGHYAKQHLVPFGEFVPKPFKKINAWLSLPELYAIAGPAGQPPIQVAGYSIASLICYEIAYQELLRKQIKETAWIVSVSDNGWCGRSLASWQQLQMAQMLSLITGRYQVVANNDGLSSIIDPKGNIIDGLPAFSAGILQSQIYPATGVTPWVLWGDVPVIILCLLIFSGFLLKHPYLKKRQAIAE